MLNTCVYLWFCLPAEIHVCCTNDGHPLHRSEGQVCKKSTHYQTLPRPACYPRAAPYRKNSWVTHSPTNLHSCCHRNRVQLSVLAVSFFSVQPVSFSLCRRLPTEHVSGQLQFRVELTSTGPDGKSANPQQTPDVMGSLSKNAAIFVASIQADNVAQLTFKKF